MNSLTYLGLFAVISCKNDTIIEKQSNTAPTILIMTHEEGAEVQEGKRENFRAAVFDDNHDADTLNVAWYVGQQVICDWALATSEGESTCEIVFDVDDKNVIAEVRDPDGAAGRFEIAVVVQPTEAPVVEILSPIAERRYYSSELIQFSASIQDAEDETDALEITWSSSLDGELTLDTRTNAQDEMSDDAYLSEGHHIVELTVEDTSGKVSRQEVLIQVNGPNHPPTCAFTAPNEGDIFLFGDSILMLGVAEDEDIPNEELQVELSSTLDGLLQNLSPFSDGTFAFSTSSLQVGTHTLTLSVEDDVGERCTTERTLFVGTPPILSVDEPLDGAIFEVGESIVFRATVSDGEEPSTDLNVVWSSSLNGELYASPPNIQGVSEFTTNVLSAGVHTLTVEVTDSTGLSTDENLQVRVNTLPVVNSVTFTPNPLFSNSNLSAVVQSADVDGQLVAHSFEWYRNAVLTGFVGTSIPSSELDVNDVWTLRVTPNDGYHNGNDVETSITVSNSEPTVITISIDPMNGVYNDSQLTCAGNATDIDQNITPLVQWDVNGQVYLGANLDLSTTSVLPEDTVLCSVIATDDWGASDVMTSTVTIENRAPILGTVNIIAGDLGQVGDTLTCESIVMDPDGEMLTASYAWSRNGVSVGVGSMFALSSDLVEPSDVLTCTATISDAYGGSDLAEGSFTVYNAPPMIDSISIEPMSPVGYDTVTCSAAVSDLDGTVVPTVGFLFENTTTGTTFYPDSFSAGEATLSLVGLAITVGDQLTCHVTVTDNGGITVTETVTTTLMDSPPTIDSIVISPDSNVEVGTTLTCTATASDYEDGTLTPTIEWTDSQGSILGDTSSLTVSSGLFVAGDVITCTATVEDGFGSVDSSTVQVTVSPSVSMNCGLTECDSNLDLGGGQSIDLVLVTAGTFTMGSPTAETGRQTEEVEHTVTLTNNFYVMTTEVTQGMFLQMMGYDAHDGQGTSNGTGTYGVGTDYPAYHTTWHMSAAFANQVTQRHNAVNGTALQECYTCTGIGRSDTCSLAMDPYLCDGYRLLTEAEWEYSARSGSGESFWTSNGGGNIPTGSESDCTQSWTLTDGTLLADLGWHCSNNNQNGGIHGSKEVASRDPNGNGLYDMHGNVGEWVNDWYDDYPTGSVTDPSGPATSFWKVYRGGYWNSTPAYMRSALRNDLSAGSGAANIGFRLGRVVLTQPSSATISMSSQTAVEGLDDLYCEILVDSVDPDGNTVAYTFDWTVDGAAYLGVAATTTHLGDTISASETVGGETWTCTVTPNDGTEDGPSTTSSVSISTLASLGCGLTDCDHNLYLGNGQSLDMLLISAGTFTMGSPVTEVGRSTNEDQHTVTLTNDFYVMTTEVTQGMFEQIMGYKSSQGSSTGSSAGSFGIGDNYPAHSASWNMAADFANAVTQRHNLVHGTSLEECYSCTGSGVSVSCTVSVNPYQCTGYRLLTEAEWEYSARAGTTAALWTPNGGGEIPSGYEGIDACPAPSNMWTLSDGSILRELVWFCGSSLILQYPFGSKEVGTSVPNDYGLYDMSGNLTEWTQDVYDLYSTAPAINPLGASQSTSTDRSTRGGAWSNWPKHLRVSKRYPRATTYRTYLLGFRLALNP